MPHACRHSIYIIYFLLGATALHGGRPMADLTADASLPSHPRHGWTKESKGCNDVVFGVGYGYALTTIAALTLTWTSQITSIKYLPSWFLVVQGEDLHSWIGPIFTAKLSTWKPTKPTSRRSPLIQEWQDKQARVWLKSLKGRYIDYRLNSITNIWMKNM